MKLKIVHGHEVDVLSPDEAREILRELLDELQPRGGSVRLMGEGQTDANGNAQIEITPRVPIGYELAIYRLVVDSDKRTPAAPFTNANGWIDVLRNGVDRLGFQGMSIPALATDGASEAPKLRNGETFVVALNGGPANELVRVRGEGELTPRSLQAEDKKTRRQ